jgi:D-ribose pyranose/furanose isomerase RbsD
MNNLMKAFVAFATSFVMTAGLAAGVSCPKGDQAWQSSLEQILPLLGHRNWILIVDSAYPLQTSAGVETLETNSSPIEVIRTVISSLDRSINVRPSIYMDAELPFVKEQDSPGVTAYRKSLKALLGQRPIQSLPHEEILKKIDEIGKTYHVLVLKTTMTVPYTSIFLQLDCKYWSDAAEQRLRQAMNESTHH